MLNIDVGRTAYGLHYYGHIVYIELQGETSRQRRSEGRNLLFSLRAGLFSGAFSACICNDISSAFWRASIFCATLGLSLCFKIQNDEYAQEIILAVFVLSVYRTRSMGTL